MDWSQILCSVDRASLYNLVNKANVVHNLFLIYLFLVNLSISMFRMTMCPSSGETTVFIRHLVLVILYGLLTILYTRQSSIENNKYQVSNKHSCLSWWWAHSHPKHIEIDKYTKNKYIKNKLCTNLLYLQDYMVNFTFYLYLYLTTLFYKHSEDRGGGGEYYDVSHWTSSYPLIIFNVRNLSNLWT